MPSSRPHASALLAGATRRALDLELEHEQMRQALEQIERGAERAMDPNNGHLDPGWVLAHCSVGLNRGGVL